MPFSPAFKAGLVAVVLVILHVPRLDAAPMEPRQALAEEFRRAINLMEDHAGPSTASNFAPGADLDHFYGHPVPEHSRANYAMQDAYLQHPHFPGNVPEPTGRESTKHYSLQTWTPAGTPDIGVRDAELRSGEGWVFKNRPLTKAHLHDFGWWSKNDPKAWLDSEWWPGLDKEAKAIALKAFGQKVFSKESYAHLKPISQQESGTFFESSIRDGDQLQRDLVKEYLKVRYEGQLASRVDIDWKPERPGRGQQFFEKFNEVFVRHRDGTKSALVYDAMEPTKGLDLGAFRIRFSGEVPKRLEFYFNNLQAETLNVVAATEDKKLRIYLGKVTIAPKVESKPVETQREPKSRSRRSSKA